MRSYLMPVALLLICLSPIPALADVHCVDYNNYIHWLPYESGNTMSSERIVVDGGLVFAGVSTLKVFHLSDPDSPHLMGELGGIGGPIARIGDHLVCLDRGVHLVDVSDPAHPQLLGSCDDRADDLAAEGDVAVGCNRSGSTEYLRVYDLDDPSTPSLLWETQLTEIIDASVTLSGDLAFVADGHSTGRALQGVDLSDPANPELLTPYVDSEAGFDDIVLRGNRLYTIGDWTGGDELLQIFDVSDPDTPVQLGTLELSVGSSNLTLVGDRLYVCAGRNHIVDVSDDADPVLLGTLPNAFGAEALGATATHAYVVGVPSHFDGGVQPAWLRVADVSMSEGAAPIGELYLGANSDVAVDGDLAHVVSNSAYSIVDLADPAAPALLGSLPFDDSPRDIVVDGHHAYINVNVSYNEHLLAIVDFADPAAPVLVGAMTLPGNRTGALAHHGDRLYLACNVGFAEVWTSHLSVVNVADPANPFLENHIWVSIDSYGRTVHVREDGQHLILGTGYWGCKLFAFSLADPAHPTHVDTYVPGGELIAAGGHGDLLVVSASSSLWGMGYGIISLLNISDPSDMSLHSTLTTAEPASDILMGGAVAPGHFYLAGGSGGLTLCSALDPADPRNLGHYAVSLGEAAAGDEFAIGLSSSGNLMTLPYACVTTAAPVSPAYGLALAAVPNPFNPSTTLSFALSSEGPVLLTVHDIAGRRVRTLVNGERPAGELRMDWNGRNDAGRPVAGGVYLVRLSTSVETATAKLVMLK